MHDNTKNDNINRQMKPYDPKKIEAKWQKFWLAKKTFVAKEGNPKSSGLDRAKGKMVLVEFPYPSGAGLHMGHMRPFIAGDVVSKYYKLRGHNVMYPMGWDAFGLPAENFAIKNKVHPSVSTAQNVKNAKKQLLSWGTGFDWSREVNTTDPSYYKWTQKIFLEFYKSGLAYEKFGEINWCPKDKTGLANEEVVDGKCERCGSAVEKKSLRQWYLKITDYAEKLLGGLKNLPEWPEPVKVQQENWIGKSEGAQIKFRIFNSQFSIDVFTTRADTLFGVTYLVLAPESELVSELLHSNVEIRNKSEIEKYINDCKGKADIDRTAEGKEKTGVVIGGVMAINPANNEKVPVWIADYVLAQYGTGAVMAVPAHDERDFQFAKKYSLPIKDVVAPYLLDDTDACRPRVGKEEAQRIIAVPIIKHWSEDKYLCLNWKVNGWKTFVTGGVENGESYEEGALREIREETGYKNLRFVKHLGGPNISYFFAPHKDRNQSVEGRGMYFELLDETKEEVSEVEKSKHEIVWIEKDKVKSFLESASAFGDQRYLLMYWNRLMTGNDTFTEEGILINSGEYNGLFSEDAKKKITESVGGRIVTKYKLRDWVFSRQRYWGEPIPLIHCDKCGIVPVPDKDLPVKLPNVKNYEPTGTGESPLAAIDKWVNTKCPKCKGKAKRETNTMPQWAGSSWYWLRYMDPKNTKEFSNIKKQEYWSPVDLYFGGMEHTTLHLLYSRFWNLMLYDKGLASVKEPYKKRVPHGIILGPDGEKMSKSRGNVVNPDDVVKVYGADTTRLYMMFLGPHGAQVAWNDKGIVGTRRFLDRAWNMQEFVAKSEPKEVTIVLHKTIKKVTEDIETFSFNTAVSSMMIFVNTVYEAKSVTKKTYAEFIKLLSPFAPHLAEELWTLLGNKTSVYTSKWPEYDGTLLVSEGVSMAVQVNGKVRGEISVPRDSDDEVVKSAALNDPKVLPHLEGREVRKVIVVKNRLVSIVV